MACKDCASGTIHDGTPTGHVETIHDLPTYVAESTSNPPKGIIVIIPDAFGWEFNNNRIMADNYAKKSNCKVLLPDFMGGKACYYGAMESMEHIMDKTKWFFTKIPSVLYTMYHFLPFLVQNREAVTKPRVYNFFRSLRTANPNSPIGASGFCWGGKWTAFLCSGWNNPSLDPDSSTNTFTSSTESSKSKTDELLIDCGYAAHPSMLNIPRDVLTLRVPFSIANGTDDQVFTPAMIEETKKIFEQKGEGKPDCELVVYEKAKHGFAVRWDPKDERQQKQGEESEEQAVKWFLKHFGAKN